MTNMARYAIKLQTLTKRLDHAVTDVSSGGGFSGK